MGLIKNILSRDLVKNIRISFRKIEKELNDHLGSINANTNEIQSIYEVLNEMDGKLQKISSRLDELQAFVDPKPKKRIIDVRVMPLTKREKEVFLALYSSSSEKLTYKDLGKVTGFEEVMVQEYLTNLIAKGVPVSKKFKNNNIYISLDREFKELQAKEKIIS